jgi:hypothetical protein
MSATVYLATFPSRAAAERTARLARDAVGGTRTIVARRSAGEQAVGRAVEAAAGRTALWGALVAVAVVVVATLALVASQVVDGGVSLALGGATAMTAAPFVGGLAGMVLGMERWHGARVEALPGFPTDEGDTWLIVRTTDPERLVEVLGQPARVTRPEPAA